MADLEIAGGGGGMKLGWVRGAGGGKRPRPRRSRVVEGAGRGSPPPAMGVRGCNPQKFLKILHAKSCVMVNFCMINYAIIFFAADTQINNHELALSRKYTHYFVITEYIT